ncbi:AIR synthase related protein [Acidianus sp. RZ1]|uniref:AIR synthase related protein n=1 Tax=Acidianus sp. RZ1 TaxID=1540082 RepID=UPI00149264C3|nr:AIR synthase related protein [Acidianus sp. RZ1]NON62922.1 thiamine-monophosphate kinase [Acidianus sp. RZ1]
MKLKDLGEHEFIRSVLFKYVDAKELTDVYSYQGKSYKIDGFQLSYTYPFMSLFDLGWKAVTSTASDLITTGSIPRLLLVSIGISPEYSVNDLELIIKGIRSASTYYGFKYVGGDLNSSSANGWIDVVGIGDNICEQHSGVSNKDKVIITGEVGFTSKIFMKYYFKLDIKPDYISLLKVKHPIVNRNLIDFQKTFCKDIVGASDLSDGILITLDQITQRLKIGIKLNLIPIRQTIIKELSQYGFNELDILKFSGEEYESIFIVKEQKLSLMLAWLHKRGIKAKVIGEVDTNKATQGSVVYNGEKIKIEGWDNFKGWF